MKLLLLFLAFAIVIASATNLQEEDEHDLSVRQLRKKWKDTVRIVHDRKKKPRNHRDRTGACRDPEKTSVDVACPLLAAAATVRPDVITAAETCLGSDEDRDKLSTWCFERRSFNRYTCPCRDEGCVDKFDVANYCSTDLGCTTDCEDFVNLCCTFPTNCRSLDRATQCDLFGIAKDQGCIGVGTLNGELCPPDNEVFYGSFSPEDWCEGYRGCKEECLMYLNDCCVTVQTCFASTP